MQGRSVGPSFAGQAVGATLVALLLAVGPGAFPSAAQEDEEDWARLPEIRVGDYWDYELSGRDHGQITNEVMARERKTNDHFELTVDTFRVESTGTVYSNQATGVLTGFHTTQGGLQELGETEHEIDAKKWVRVEDYATLQLEGKVIIEGSVEADVLEAFDPAFVQSFYPYTKDYEWVSQAEYYLKRGGEDPVQGVAKLRAQVTAIETVEVPAGSFQTWRLETDIEYEGERVTSNVVQWWSQEACGIVKEERFDRDGELLNRMELSDFDCSGEHLEEPSYSGKGVKLEETGGHEPPWLDEPLDRGGLDDDANDLTGTALPSGPVIWIALGMMAGISVMFFILGRRRGP